MPYTLAEAAQATGLNRSTLLRSIKAGSGRRGWLRVLDGYRVLSTRITKDITG